MGDDRRGPPVSRMGARPATGPGARVGCGGAWAAVPLSRLGKTRAQAECCGLGRARVEQRAGLRAALGPKAIFHFSSPSSNPFSIFC